MIENCLAVQLNRLRKQSQLGWQIYLADRETPNHWWSSLLRPAESRRARARAEVSAESAWEYTVALEEQVARLTQHAKNAEGCLSLLGSARNQEHLDEMIVLLRADGIQSVMHHADHTSELVEH